MKNNVIKIPMHPINEMHIEYKNREKDRHHFTNGWLEGYDFCKRKYLFTIKSFITLTIIGNIILWIVLMTILN